MFRNIGHKIKVLAIIVCACGIFFSLVSGAFLILAGIFSARGPLYVPGQSFYISGGILIAAGILVMLFGSLFSWLSTFFMYGYGQMVENTDRIDQHLQNLERNMAYSGEMLAEHPVFRE